MLAIASHMVVKASLHTGVTRVAVSPLAYASRR